MNAKRISALLVLCALFTVGTEAMAQQVSIGNVLVDVDATSVNVPVTFTAGGGVASYQLDFTITRGGSSPIAPSGHVSRVQSDGWCSGSAISQPDGSAIRIIDIDFNNDPLPSGTTCVLTFPLDAGNLQPGDTITLTPHFVEFNAPDGETEGAVIPGSIAVRHGPRTGPLVTYLPAPDPAPATIRFPASGTLFGTTTATIGVSGTGGQDGITTIRSCRVVSGSGVSFAGFTPMVCTAGGTCVDGNDGSITATCVGTEFERTGTFECIEARQNETFPGDGNAVLSTRTWGFTCPSFSDELTILPAIANGSSISLPPVGFGQPTRAVVAFSVSGGSTGSATVSDCSVGAPFTLLPANPTLTFDRSGSPTTQSFEVGCTMTDAAQGPQDLVCAVDGSPYRIAVTCPAAVLVAAPTIRATPSEDQDGIVDSTAEVTFPLLVGPDHTTATIHFDVTGGVDDGNGFAETVSINDCAITNNAAGTISITTQPAATAFGTGDPAGDIDATIDLRCNDNPFLATAELRCTLQSATTSGTTTEVRLWQLKCPSEGGGGIPPPSVTLVSVPSSPAVLDLEGMQRSSLATAVALRNMGTAPLNISNCLAEPDAASITYVPPATTIAPAGGSGSLDFSCIAPGPNSTVTETVSCSTNANNAPTISFTLNCSGLASLPIPAVGGAGKALLAALVIGLGLVGLGLGRATR